MPNSEQSLFCPPQRNPFIQEQGAQPFDRTKEIFNVTWWLYFHNIASFLGRPLVRQGLRSDRLALDPGSVRPATLFTETDTGLIYQMRVVDGVAGWYYVAGIYALLQADIPTFAATLGTGDAGALMESTDYCHKYRWDGSALGFDPGDEGSGKIVAGSDGFVPNGGLWALCDGGTYGFAQADGTVDTGVTPDLTGDVALLGAAAADTSSRPAGRATWDAAAKTEDESDTHTHSVTVLGSTDYEAGGFSAVYEQTVATGTESATHYHDLTDTNAKLNVPSESNGGLGVRYALIWFQRR